MVNKSNTYRVMVCLFALTVTAHGATVQFDAHGKNGQDGRDGYSFDTSPGASSGRGERGGDASISTPGTIGGRIQLQMKDMAPAGETLRARMLVTGTVSANNVRQEIEVMPGAQIFLDARGGKGGDGGNGGDGQGGCNGFGGTDATEFRAGTDGSRGCNGGSGGNATPGSDGGPGGNIEVRLAAEDMHLALLVSWDVDGGNGGAGSRLGQGGQGGRGGYGGRSHSWSKREYMGKRRVPYRRPVTRSRMVSRSNGNGTYSSVPESYTDYVDDYDLEDYYELRHYSNPGGSDGYPGSSGTSGGGSTTPGRNGNKGQFEFIVENADGREERYTEPFSLRLLSYDFADENGDGVFEPGERVRVYNLRVQNTSRMPTPGPKAKVLTMLSNRGWVSADPQALEIPQLNGGEARVLPGELRFQIKNNRLMVSNERSTVQESIVPMAQIQRISATVDSYRLPKLFTISYPIELTAFSASALTLGPGESAALMWKIKNLSKKDIGTGTSLARAVQLSLNGQKGEAKSRSLKVFAPDGSPVEVEQAEYRLGIPSIPAGQTVAIEGRVEVRADAIPYTRYGLQTALQLRPYLGGDPATVQTGSLSVRIAQTYHFNPEAQVLVVTNAQTTRAQIEGLKRRLVSLGIKYDVWDYSYYGFFNLTKELQQKGSRSLLSNYQGRTIILMTDLNPRNGTDGLLEQISKEDFALAAMDNQINFLLLGSSRTQLESYIRSRTLPERVAMKGLAKSEKDLLQQVATEQKDQLSGIGFVVEGTQNDKTEKVLRERAQGFMDKLNKTSPGQQYFVTYNISPQKIKSNDREAWSLGQIFLYRGLDARSGQLSAAVFEKQEMNSSSVFESETFQRSLYSALNVAQKARILSDNYGMLDSPSKGLLKASMIADLLEEENNLPYLKSLRQSPSSIQNFAQATTADGFTPALAREETLDILAAAYFYSTLLDSDARSFYQQIFFSSVKASVGLSKEQFLKLSESRIQGLQQQLSNRAKALIGYDQRTNAFRMMTLPAYYRVVRSLNIIQRERQSPLSVQWVQPQGGF